MPRRRDPLCQRNRFPRVHAGACHQRTQQHPWRHRDARSVQLGSPLQSSVVAVSTLVLLWACLSYIATDPHFIYPYSCSCHHFCSQPISPSTCIQCSQCIDSMNTQATYLSHLCIWNSLLNHLYSEYAARQKMGCCSRRRGGEHLYSCRICTYSYIAGL